MTCGKQCTQSSPKASWMGAASESESGRPIDVLMGLFDVVPTACQSSSVGSAASCPTLPSMSSPSCMVMVAAVTRGHSVRANSPSSFDVKLEGEAGSKRHT